MDIDERPMQFCFRDRRTPEHIAFALEGSLRTLLAPGMEGESLVYRGAVKVPDLTMALAVELRFEDAAPHGHAYAVRGEAQALLPAYPVTPRQAAGWFGAYTNHLGFQEDTEPPPRGSDRAAYRALAASALAAFGQPDTVAAIQAKIASAMADGATFSTAHKEGGTRIFFVNGKYRRADYGESDDWEIFKDEAAFFAWLRQFFDWDLTRSWYPDPPSELQVWQLLLRMMREG